MTDRTQPDSGRATGAAHIIRYALELGLLWIDGDGRDKVREALDALDALEAKLASIGAGGVQALSAAPAEQQVASSAVLKAIREANMQLVHTGDDTFMLVPYKVATTEAVTPKAGATTGAASVVTPYAVYAPMPRAAYIEFDGREETAWHTPDQMRDFADRTYALRMEQAAPKAAPGERLTRNQIREVFMAHGFTIKEGQTDLKQYVYDAAHALLELVEAPQQEAQEPVATQWLAEMIMSDCGCSTQNQRLLDRIVERITRYDAANTAPPPAPACHHRPPCAECASLTAQGGE